MLLLEQLDGRLHENDLIEIRLDLKFCEANSSLLTGERSKRWVLRELRLVCFLRCGDDGAFGGTYTVRRVTHILNIYYARVGLLFLNRI